MPVTRAKLGLNSYGKSRVRVMKVSRTRGRHAIHELAVDIALQGDFDAIHTHGDNRTCLPTDTMKNTVYALARKDPLHSIESFAARLARHFIDRNNQVSSATISISQTPWVRQTIRGREHPHCFVKGTDERPCGRVVLTRTSPKRKPLLTLTGGISHLVLLKSTDSAFSGFLCDEYTTLKATEDRIFATSLSAEWDYTTDNPDRADLPAARARIRDALIATFARHKSKSVQHTLYAMGQAALKSSRAIRSIDLTMPNKHCLLVDLAPFGLTNPNEIFVPTDEPHGLIHARVQRR